MSPKLRAARLDGLALLAGAIFPFAFSPLSVYPLAVLSLTLLFSLWQEISAKRAAWRGFLFGLGQFSVGVSWLYVALHTYGQMPPVLAGLALLAFFSYLACFPALVGWLQGSFFSPSGIWVRILAIPALWTAGEWLRGWLLTGFPWLVAGYSQIDGPLAGLAPWLGVYGVSLAVAVTAGLVLEVGRNWRGAAKRYVTVLVALWIGAWAAGRVSWVKPAGAPLQVALVQGNVPLEQKWVPAFQQSILSRYTDLTFEQRGVNLVVWPEAAVPLYRDEIEHNFLPQLTRAADARHMAIIFGILERDQVNGETRYYNSVMNVGSQPGVYRKRHLVPFGEYLPFARELNWLLDYLHIPMSDFSAGPAQQRPLMVDGQSIGMSVCYEDAFGQEILRSLPQATLLANVTEDAWYGDSFAPHQQLEMARMRALETDRQMVLATNNGVTAIVNNHGRVTAQAPQFRVWVLTGTVTPLEGATPYVIYGNRPVLILLAIFFAGPLALRGVRILMGWKRNKLKGDTSPF